MLLLQEGTSQGLRLWKVFLKAERKDATTGSQNHQRIQNMWILQSSLWPRSFVHMNKKFPRKNEGNYFASTCVTGEEWVFGRNNRFQRLGSSGKRDCSSSWLHLSLIIQSTSSWKSNIHIYWEVPHKSVEPRKVNPLQNRMFDVDATCFQTEWEKKSIWWWRNAVSA